MLILCVQIYSLRFYSLTLSQLNTCKHQDVTCVHRWSAQNQRGQGLSSSAVPSSLALLGSSGWWWQGGFWSCLLCSQWIFASEFYWLSDPGILGRGFAHYFHFPILSVLLAAASPPFGMRGRRKVCGGWCAPLACPPALRAWGLSAASRLGWAGPGRSGGVNSACPSFIAVNHVVCCQCVPLF